MGSFGGNTVHVHGSNFVGTLTGSSTSQMLTAPTFYCYEIRMHHVTTIFQDIVQRKLLYGGPAVVVALI